MMNNSCALSAVLTVPPQFCNNAYRCFLCLAGEFKRRRGNPDEKYMANGHFPGMNHRYRYCVVIWAREAQIVSETCGKAICGWAGRTHRLLSVSLLWHVPHSLRRFLASACLKYDRSALRDYAFDRVTRKKRTLKHVVDHMTWRYLCVFTIEAGMRISTTCSRLPVSHSPTDE